MNIAVGPPIELPTRESSLDAKFILWALNKLGKPMYQGTVPRHVIARRRARSKMARISRRRNRVA